MFTESETAKYIQEKQPSIEGSVDGKSRKQDRLKKLASELIRKRHPEFSPTLIENPQATLDHYAETERYLDTLPAEYRKQVEALAAQIGEPMGAEVKIVSCIPVAGHQEGGNIYESLENYTRQTLSPEQFELVLFVNHPTVDKEGKPVEPDETLDEIKRFQTEHPEIKVRVMYQALPPEQAKIGMIRKMLNDATLMRHHTRGKDAPDLVMVSNDADNKGISPAYYESFLKKFEDDPELEGVLGQLDWDPEAYVRYPEVFIGTRLFMYLGAIDRKRRAIPISSGANFGFKSSIYSAIGGYNAGKVVGEDVILGSSFREIRQSRSVVGYNKDALVYTSARRAIDSWKKGRAPVEQWDTQFSALDELRKEQLDRSVDVDYDDPEVQEKLRKNIEVVINRTFAVYGISKKLSKNNTDVRKILNALGIPHYEIIEKNDIRLVEISDMSPIIDKLKRYKEIVIAQKELHSGIQGGRETYLEIKRAQRERKRVSQEKIKQDYREEYDKFIKAETLPSDIGSYEPSGLHDVNPKITNLEQYLQVHHQLSSRDAINIIIRACEAVRVFIDQSKLPTNIAPETIAFSNEGIQLATDESSIVSLNPNGTAHKERADGSRFTMPPELMEPRFKELGIYKFDKTVGVYEAASTLYKMITGEWPYILPEMENNTPQDADAAQIFDQARYLAYANNKKEKTIFFPPQVPHELQAVLGKALSPYPESRQQSIEEFGLELIKINNLLN